MSASGLPYAEQQLEAFLNSPARLAAVRATQLLDSPAEECFDSMTRLATLSLGVPLSYVTVLDADRDYFKSQSGFPEPLATTRELTGRTFCHYAAVGGDVLAIDDTHANPLWANVPSVRSQGVRAFMGMPMTLEGQQIGNFCVADLQPRRWSDKDRDMIIQLAQSTQRELALRMALSRGRIQTQRAEALARAKEELIAVIAHDLRNPLQALDLTLTLLRLGGAEQRETAIARARTAVLTMRRIADELLSEDHSLTQLLDGQELVSTRTIASNALDMMRPIAERKQISLVMEHDDDALIAADFGQMLRVFSNIIGNAIKYSSSDSAVRFGCRTVDSTVVYSVSDEGPGMTKTEQQRVFDRGWQGVLGAEEGAGHGLGLAIVKQIVEQHGGSVAVHSTPGAGSRFDVVMPLVTSPERTRPDAIAPRDAGAYGVPG